MRPREEQLLAGKRRKIHAQTGQPLVQLIELTAFAHNVKKNASYKCALVAAEDQRRAARATDLDDIRVKLVLVHVMPLFVGNDPRVLNLRNPQRSTQCKDPVV